MKMEKGGILEEMDKAIGRYFMIEERLIEILFCTLWLVARWKVGVSPISK